MELNTILLVFPEQVVENTLYLASKFTKAFNSKLIILILEKKEHQNEETIKMKLNQLNLNYQLFIEKNGIKDKINQYVDKYLPDLIIIPHEKIDPMVHIFKHPATEKFVEKFDKTHILFPIIEAKDIQKSIIYIDPDSDNEQYIKASFEILSKVSHTEFIYAFHEEYFEYSLIKTHPEDEAKRIIKELYQEGIEKSKQLIAKALNKEVTLKVIKGDPKKEVPFFALKNGYDLLAINIHHEDKKSFIENSEISIGLFKG
ncbi:MAG: hypothetical protein GXO22_00935 [Aquificae bacterium]|nr:hypothetical protein [Aquificota bacterium]